MKSISTLSIEDKIFKEQVRLLYAALPVSVIATLISALLLSYVLHAVIEDAVLIGWLLAVVVIGLLRVVVYLYFKLNLTAQQNTKKSFRYFVLGSTASALTWGLASFILFAPGELPYQVFLALILAGMCAGAVSSLAFLKLPINLYLCIALLPLSARMFYEGGELSYPFGVISFFFLLILVTTSNRIYSRVRENILLRFEAANSAQEIQESEEKYRTIFEAAPVGIVQYDASAIILNANQAAFKLFADTPESLIGKNFKKIESNEFFSKAVNDSLCGKNSEYSAELTIINGENQLPIRVFFTGLKGNNEHVIGGLAIVEDVAEQRRVQALKSEFIATVSHELRTPLMAIKSSIDLLELVPQESRQELINILKRNSDRLIHLVNDILEIDKIAAGGLSFDLANFDVMTLVEQAVKDNQGYAAQQDTKLTITRRVNGVMINVDNNRFLQIVTNLLSNAAKFTRSGTSVYVEVLHIENNLVVNFIDFGEGIPREFQATIFDKFTQADSSTTRRAGGAGLGLYITKQLVEAMNGRIYYQTTQNEGCVFSIEFPVVLTNL